LESESVIVRALLAQVRVRLAALHAGQDGYSTEAVIAIAVLVVAAITALGYIATKVVTKAKRLSID
jgi:hypothetical protein